MLFVQRWQAAILAIRQIVTRWFPLLRPRSLAGMTGRATEQQVVEQFFASQIQKKLGYRFRDVSLLILALKHRSYVYAQEQTGVQSNERLEFLGDAVLDLIVSEYLYQSFPERREGGLTQLRSALVNKVTLATKAQQMNLGKHLLLSEGEARAGGRHRGSILSDAYESLVGAIYLDGGIEPARQFIIKTLLDDVAKFDTARQWMNYKSLLLEYTQSEGKGQPRYRVEAEEGPDHRKIFTVEVYIAGTPVGKGTGTSKKDAEQNAARDATERLNLLPTIPERQ